MPNSSFSQTDRLPPGPIPTTAVPVHAKLANFVTRVEGIYQALYQCHGPQHWWPGETPFEVMVGAVLTQNTAWSNVERAIVNLKRAASLDAVAILAAPHDQLAAWLQPSGYFNVKAHRLRNFCAWYLEQGGVEALSRLDTRTLRSALLAVNGIGPETADDILLYALQRPVFVIDAYTRRLFARLGLVGGAEPYEVLRALVEEGLEQVGQATMQRYNEYHALIVIHAKNVCRPRPRCTACCLAAMCPSAELESA